MQIYLVLAHHLIAYRAKKWPEFASKINYIETPYSGRLGFYHLIASANIIKWLWKTIVLSERRPIFDAHDSVSKLLRHSSCLQNIVSLRQADRDATHDILF